MADILNFSIIGAGRFAKNHIKQFSDLYGANLAAIASRSEDTLKEIKDKVAEDTLLTTNIDEAIKKSDCVIIATPPKSHFEIAKLAIEQGKHVLLEKPMTTNLSDAIKLSKIVEKSKSTFMVGHQYVYNDYIKYLKDNLKDFGKVNFVLTEHYNPGPMSEVGCIWDAGTHKFSIIQHLFNPGKIKDVKGKSLDLLENGLDDFDFLNVEFNDLNVQINLSWIAHEKTRRVILYGDKKVAAFDDVASNKLKLYNVLPKNKQKRSIYTEYLEKVQQLEPEIPYIKANEPLKNQLNHFIHCIKNNKEPLTGIKSSLEITEWLDFVSRKVN